MKWYQVFPVIRLIKSPCTNVSEERSSLNIGPDGEQYNWCVWCCTLDFSKDWLHKAMAVARLQEWVSTVHHPLNHANPTTCKPDYGNIQITYAFLLCLSKIGICFTSWTHKELYQHNWRGSKKRCKGKRGWCERRGCIWMAWDVFTTEHITPSKHTLKLWCHNRSKVKHLGEELL